MVVSGEKGGTANVLTKAFAPVWGGGFFYFHHHNAAPSNGAVYNNERSVARHGKGTDEKTEAGRPATHQDF